MLPLIFKKNFESARPEKCLNIIEYFPKIHATFLSYFDTQLHIICEEKKDYFTVVPWGPNNRLMKFNDIQK